MWTFRMLRTVGAWRSTYHIGYVEGGFESSISKISRVLCGYDFLGMRFRSVV